MELTQWRSVIKPVVSGAVDHSWPYRREHKSHLSLRPELAWENESLLRETVGKSRHRVQKLYQVQDIPSNSKD